MRTLGFWKSARNLWRIKLRLSRFLALQCIARRVSEHQPESLLRSLHSDVAHAIATDGRPTPNTKKLCGACAAVKSVSVSRQLDIIHRNHAITQPPSGIVFSVETTSTVIVHLHVSTVPLGIPSICSGIASEMSPPLYAAEVSTNAILIDILGPINMLVVVLIATPSQSLAHGAHASIIVALAGTNEVNPMVNPAFETWA